VNNESRTTSRWVKVLWKVTKFIKRREPYPYGYRLGASLSFDSTTPSESHSRIILNSAISRAWTRFDLLRNHVSFPPTLPLSISVSRILLWGNISNPSKHSNQPSANPLSSNSNVEVPLPFSELFNFIRWCYLVVWGRLLHEATCILVHCLTERA